MYIRRKVFSVGIDEYGEERLFSVNEVISEESYQRLFARRDYEGLSEIGKEELKKRRSEYAKSLRKAYRDANKKLENSLDSLSNRVSETTTKGEFSGGGVRSNYKVHSVIGPLDSVKGFKRRHKNAVIDTLLDKSKKAARIMRNETLIKR